MPRDLFTVAAPKFLRPYQADALTRLHDSLAKGYRHVVLQLPTGAGKTLIAAHIIRSALRKGRRVLFVVAVITLVDKTIRDFEAEGIEDIGVMQGNHPRTSPLARVQIASVQTLAVRGIPKVDLIIVDECHIRSKNIENYLLEPSSPHAIGLSATPWAKGMGKIWGDLVVVTSTAALIEAGTLSRFLVYAPDVPDLSGVRCRLGDYANAQLAKVMGQATLVGSVVQTWLEKADDRPTLVFAVNRAHAAQLSLEFERHGIATAYVDGETDSIERRLIFDRFAAGEIRVICSVRTLTTGVDLPVSCIVDAAPTKSEILHVQKIGRGLRVNPGTEDCLILDHAGNALRLGLVTDIYHQELDAGSHRRSKRSSERGEKLPTPCNACEVLHTGDICPGCGHERERPSGVTCADGKLVAINKTGRERAVSQQDFWSMALWLDAEREKGGRLAKSLFKERFGTWPSGLRDMPMPADQAFLNYEKSRRIAYAHGKRPNQRRKT